MSILPPLLFGISASLDALLVGMALGLQKMATRQTRTNGRQGKLRVLLQ